MTDRERDYVAGFMNRVPFVRWDRFTDAPDGIRVFGWIHRINDLRSDFVVLEFGRPTEEWNPAYTTSSAQFSEQIGELLYGQAAQGAHHPCQRVEDAFGSLIQNFVMI